MPQVFHRYFEAHRSDLVDIRAGKLHRAGQFQVGNAIALVLAPQHAILYLRLRQVVEGIIRGKLRYPRRDHFVVEGLTDFILGKTDSGVAFAQSEELQQGAPVLHPRSRHIRVPGPRIATDDHLALPVADQHQSGPLDRIESLVVVYLKDGFRTAAARITKGASCSVVKYVDVVEIRMIRTDLDVDVARVVVVPIQTEPVKELAKLYLLELGGLAVTIQEHQQAAALLDEIYEVGNLLVADHRRVLADCGGVGREKENDISPFEVFLGQRLFVDPKRELIFQHVRR